MKITFDISTDFDLFFCYVLHCMLGIWYGFLGVFSSFQVIFLLQNKSQPTDHILFSI